MDKLKSVILAFRPKTLTAALVPCVAATALVPALGYQIDWQVFWFALLASFFIQIGTNLVNDAVDFKKGADTEKRIGPQRITQAGILSANQVMGLATLFFILAILCGIPLVIKGGGQIVIIGILSVLMGYAYTAGPFPLAYLGLGDLFVVIFFGLVAVSGMVFLHTGLWLKESLILGLQIGLHATVLIAINNLRDSVGDGLVNKKTLAVRFGPEFVRYEILFLTTVPFALNAYWLQRGWTWTWLLTLPLIGLVIFINKNIRRHKPGPIYNQFLGQSAALHLFFGLLLSLGFWISHR